MALSYCCRADFLLGFLRHLGMSHASPEELPVRVFGEGTITCGQWLHLPDDHRDYWCRGRGMGSWISEWNERW